MRELSQSVRPVERTDYLPDWPGFNTVFDMRVTAATKKCRVELDGSFESEMAQSAMPHVLLAEQLVRAIQPLEAFRSDFDVLFRSEEHTSELQSLMRISYAVFCLKKKKQNNTNNIHTKP